MSDHVRLDWLCQQRDPDQDEDDDHDDDDQDDEDDDGDVDDDDDIWWWWLWRDDEPSDLVVPFFQANPFKNRISSTMCSGRFICDMGWLGVWRDDAILFLQMNVLLCPVVLIVPAPVMRFS